MTRRLSAQASLSPGSPAYVALASREAPYAR